MLVRLTERGGLDVLAVAPGNLVGPFLDEGYRVVKGEHQVAGIHAEQPCASVEEA